MTQSKTKRRVLLLGVLCGLISVAFLVWTLIMQAPVLMVRELLLGASLGQRTEVSFVGPEGADFVFQLCTKKSISLDALTGEYTLRESDGDLLAVDFDLKKETPDEWYDGRLRWMLPGASASGSPSLCFIMEPGVSYRLFLEFSSEPPAGVDLALRYSQWRTYRESRQLLRREHKESLGTSSPK